MAGWLCERRPRFNRCEPKRCPSCVTLSWAHRNADTGDDFSTRRTRISPGLVEDLATVVIDALSPITLELTDISVRSMQLVEPNNQTELVWGTLRIADCADSIFNNCVSIMSEADWYCFTNLVSLEILIPTCVCDYPGSSPKHKL